MREVNSGQTLGLAPESDGSPEPTVVPPEVLVERLLRSVQISSLAGLVGMAGVALVLLLVLPSPWLLAILAGGVIHQVALAAIRRLCRRGAVARAAVAFCVNDWAIVLVALAIVPAVAPALVPIVIARVVSTLPYLDRVALKRLLVAVLGVSVLVGALSRIDLVGVDDQVPVWVVTAFVVAFVPIGVVIVGVDLWQHSATLVETAQGALRANAGLQSSQRRLAEQAEELRRSRARLVTVADLERRRIERDLHDGAQQTLVGLCLGLAVQVERHPPDTPLGTELRRLEACAQDAVAELRQLAHGVYPPILADSGLAPALEAVLARCLVPVRARVEPVRRRPPEQEAALYFSFREALQNVEKHAGRYVSVRVALSEDTDGTMRLIVADDGPGLNDVSGGQGLTNMRDRLAAVGGELKVRSAPGEGTQVTAVLPAVPRTGPAQPSSSSLTAGRTTVAGLA